MENQQRHYRDLMARLLASHSQNEKCVERSQEILDGRYDEHPPNPAWGGFMMAVYRGDYEQAIKRADPLNFHAFAQHAVDPSPDQPFMNRLRIHFMEQVYQAQSGQ